MSIESAKEALEKAEEHYKKVIYNSAEQKALRRVQGAKEAVKKEEVAELEGKAKELDRRAQEASQRVEEISSKRVGIVQAGISWERDKQRYFGLVQSLTGQAVALRGRIKELVTGIKVQSDVRVNPDNVIDESQVKGVPGGGSKKAGTDEKGEESIRVKFDKRVSRSGGDPYKITEEVE